MAGYAQEHIYYTLMELMNEKSLDEIKVYDIVSRGNINRKTFYYHFHGMEDLLKWRISMLMSALDLKDADSGNWKEKMRQWICLIERNNRFFCAVFGSKYAATVSSFLCAKMRPYISRFVENCIKETEQNRAAPIVIEAKFFNYIVDYYLKGTMSLVEEWIHGACEERPEDFLNIIDNLTKNTIFNVIDAFCPRESE